MVESRSLTLAEATERAARLSHVSYRVDLDLTGGETFGSRSRIRFTSTVEETFLELHRGSEVSVRINGVEVDDVGSVYDGHRVRLAGLVVGRNEVVVAAQLPVVTDGDGMHAFTDPVDGERYLSAYVGIDITQRVFACFDQVDLKAPITLTVLADPAWTVLANALPVGRDGGRWTFAPTPPIPCDLFVRAGPWHSVAFHHDGLPMALHTRRSLAAELDRDAPEIERITRACYDRLTTMFDEPFPFDSYDQVFVPGLNWGAMETPGCVTFRDEYLPRGRATASLREQRAMVIAHEMSHMWFGDLVSQVWWDDTWLNESFAEYIGVRVGGEAAGLGEPFVPFEVVLKPGAYLADRRRSAHPVAPCAEDVPDVDTAFANFDSISYFKGGAALRQLVTWMGDEDFLVGLNAHLTRHRFANATLADLVAALDAASTRDVTGWAEVWLRQSGHDTIRVERDGEVPVLVREGHRPHRVTVTAYDGQLAEVARRLVDLDAEPVALPEWAGLVVVANALGETFARVEPDDRSRAAVAEGLSRIEDDLVRAVLWAGAFDAVDLRSMPVDDYVDLVARHLPHERHPSLVESAVDRLLESVVPRRAEVHRAAAIHDAVAEACLAGLPAHRAGDDEERALALTRGVVRSSRDPELLGRWITAGRTDDGLELDPELRWRAVARLASLGGLDPDAIEAERRRDGTADGDLHAATALAARPTPEAKAAAWSQLVEDADISNRRFRAIAAGLWSAERPDLVVDQVAAYFRAGPALAARGQAMSGVIGHSFPAVRLTDDQLDLLRAALAGDVPTVLRRAWEDALDDRT